MKRLIRHRPIRAILLLVLTFLIALLLYEAILLPRRERLHTALIRATFANQEATALQLLKQGADVNLLLDAQTHKPLPSSWIETLYARLRRQAYGDSSRRVPLLAVAAAYSRHALATDLLTRGADAEATDSLGSTALMYAADHNDREILLDLLTAHAVVNHQNKAGNTALHLAIAQKNAVNAALLLAHGANPNLANARGQTPLDDLALVAADMHRQWLNATLNTLFGSHPAPRAKTGTPGLMAPPPPTPETLLRAFQHRLSLLRPLVSLLQKNGATTAPETQRLLDDSFQLDPHEADTGLTAPGHH